MKLRIAIAALAAAVTLTISAQSLDSKFFGEMRYRMIGPFRGGRTVAAVGVPGQPNVFYIGVNNGGVWKTTDFGRVWTPIFDDQPSGSIGAIAIAPSDPNVVYVGSGEGLQRPDLSTGDGIYRSSDEGRTWQHLGLNDGQQIPAIVVDPRDPNRILVAVLGHPYGPNAERGVFRSRDGGRTFEKVLFRDENTGAIDLALDPSNPDTLYAALWQARQGPWENGAFTGPGCGLFKSTDGGTTWKPLTKGLPSAADGLGRIGFDVSRSDPKRIYAIVNATKLGGVYRSDDAGESWARINTDDRLWGRDGDFCEIRVNPKNADMVYIANVVTWKSTDGGKTFSAFRGAPGGDDYHRIWISPENPDVILIASDQGAIITVNAGATFSSWYNQPTAQFYHVNTDNAFPYRVCGGQQESGSACVQSRGDDGQITFREWHPVGAEEYGFAVPDPLDPDIVFGGKLSRYDRRIDQEQQVGPKPLRGSGYRVVRTQPVVFSPVDPHILYFASNTLWKTTDGARSWMEISPDLTRKSWSVPANVGVFATAPEAKPSQRGVIYTIAPSPLEVGRIWIGTDDGLIQLTTDGGKSWSDVTPSALVPWAKVSVMEASHFDALTAYAAINTFRLDDLRPHVLRTRDGGKSWSEIVSGIPNGGIINVVREDPKTRGLLFAGSEQAIFVSFDDGDHWQSLRLNMPATSIRDLVLHGDDLVVGTHGRGFWILDDIEPLRQIGGKRPGTAVALLRPQTALRWRWNKNTDTPIPQEEPAGQNPPEGAIIDYWLASDASQPVKLEILDSAGKVIRRYESTDKTVPPSDQGQIPAYWIRPPQVLSARAGLHRFTWDLRLQPFPSAHPRYGMAAIFHDTPEASSSPFAMPGRYTVRLTAGATSVTQPMDLVMDPRVKTPHEGLQQQFDLSKQIYGDALALQKASGRAEEIRHSIDAARAKSGSSRKKELDDLDKKVTATAGATAENEFGPPPAVAVETLSSVAGSERALLSILQGSDEAPTSQVVAAVTQKHAAFEDVIKRWSAVEAEAKRLIHE